MPPHKKIEPMAFEEFQQLYRKFDPALNVEISPSSWVLPNRVGFTDWIHKTFKYPGKWEPGKTNEPFPSQRFIKDFLQYESPYRGILLYHGVGLGKTCASIIAAENLIGYMPVIVLTPASLRTNYIDEIKLTCGNRFFSIHQNWMKVPLYKIEKILEHVSNVMFVSSEYITKKGGIWIPTNTNSNNFTGLNNKQQLEINAQLDHMIQNKYTFYNYNGLQNKHIDALVKNSATKNPFDNKVIVIDEVHNLISATIGGGGGDSKKPTQSKERVAERIYNFLIKAKNAKLILLSGTPIINYPFEISYIVNLILGQQSVYTFTSSNKLDIDNVSNALQQHPYIDYFDVLADKNEVKIKLVPEGFVFKDKHNIHKVVRDNSKKTLDEIFKEINIIIGGTKTKVQKTDNYLLPFSSDEFSSHFLDYENDTIKNQRQLSRRMLGSISYFGTYDGELYPKLNPTQTILLPFSEYQYDMYVQKRAEEIKKEKQQFKKKNKTNLFENVSQVFKAYSRMCCNFVFPKDIPRPYPSTLREMKTALKNELTVDEDEKKEESTTDLVGGVGDDEAKQKKLEKQREYETTLDRCLKELKKHSSKYLVLNELYSYSPKFSQIIPRVSEVKGKCLVYSQFRSVEGLGILAMALDANGWTEFKIKKQNNKWVLDIKQEDMEKPKYFRFMGGDKNTKEMIYILLKIFNNDLEAVPDTIREALPKVDNLRGDLLKLIMITQSGAEGISLKQVRQVHIMEPYWNEIRVNQVIGRAVRANSHQGLPSSERQVDVFRYICTLTEKQSKSKTLNPDKERKTGKVLTTDESILNIALRKDKIVSAIQDIMKITSVDCNVHSKYQKTLIKCIEFPKNKKPDELSYHIDIDEDEKDVEYHQKLKTKLIKSNISYRKCTINGVSYAYDAEHQIFYDLNMYLQGKLIEVGKLIKDDTTGKNKFVYL